MAIATGTAIALGVAAGTAGGSAIAAHETAGAAEQGATTTSQAANYAADVKAKSDAASLAFEQQKDRETQAQFNATQRANYDQWAARETRMNDIRQQLGMPMHEIPPYVAVTGATPTSSAPAPGATPTSATPSAGGAPTTTATGNPTDRATILQNLTNVYKSLGVTPTGRGTGPTDIEYMADQVANTGGWTPANAGYWPTRIAQELGKAGGGAAPSTAAPQNTLASFLPGGTTAATPPTVPQLPYMTSGQIYSPTVGSYFPQQQA